ncbi:MULTISPECIES: hypothetical protein [Clostridium]|jgi:hypothetical protein|uniref:hypothetical protein n=1 Tax=Clostridium TaxID=1485 RepID=UPI000C07C992|nr:MULTISPECIES: hypothetical protein [Clostridium]MDB2086458.1 hypothetical protein [Clostridium paraputrificum]MDB2101769.1 hypothetical protein [Clostridium paraputrificum]MDU4728175.1 hypothetical protein [Clostridium sp.]DAU43764.1 MAG TPA: hypothetical protein [Caudoviricetes sp.]
MENQISKERAEELVKTILEKREQSKDTKAYITGAKEELEQFLIQNDLTEWKCKYGTVKIADSVREGLEKEKVEAAITKINNKEIDSIDIKDLYKEIDVHSISIKASKEEI